MQALNVETLLQRWLKNLGFYFGYGHMLGHSPGIVSRMLFLISWQDELGDHTGCKGFLSPILCDLPSVCTRLNYALKCFNRIYMCQNCRLNHKHLWSGPRIVQFETNFSKLMSCYMQGLNDGACNCRMARKSESLWVTQEPRDLVSGCGPDAVCYCFLMRLSLT